jgi:hypothetical protein
MITLLRTVDFDPSFLDFRQIKNGGGEVKSDFSDFWVWVTQLTKLTKRPWLVVLSVCGLVIGIIFLCFCLAGRWLVPDFGTDLEYQDLTYEQYKSHVGLEGFDPLGGSHIYYRVWGTRDTSDAWWKVDVPGSAYENLVQAEDRRFSNLAGKYPVGKGTSRDIIIPRNWPRPDTSPPTWWGRPRANSDMECKRWELQLDTDPHSGRSTGTYYAYDRASSTLWIWSWNHQHHNLRLGESPY